MMFGFVRNIFCSFCKNGIAYPVYILEKETLPSTWKIRTDKQSKITYYWCGMCNLSEEEKKFL